MVGSLCCSACSSCVPALASPTFTSDEQWGSDRAARTATCKTQNVFGLCPGFSAEDADETRVSERYIVLVYGTAMNCNAPCRRKNLPKNTHRMDTDGTEKSLPRPSPNRKKGQLVVTPRLNSVRDSAGCHLCK